MTGIPKGTLFFTQPPDEAIYWLVQEIGPRPWLKRTQELQSVSAPFERGSVMERHHVEICIAEALRRLASGEDISALFEQPFIDAFAFATFSKALHAYLSPVGQRRHIGLLKQGLKSDHGFAALRTEYTAIQMALGAGCQVLPADMEGVATYDLLLSDQGEEVELECKLLTYDFAKSVRISDCQRLYRALYKFHSPDLLRADSSRIAWLTLRQTLPRKDEELQALALVIASAVCDRPYKLPDYVQELQVEDWPLGVSEPDRVHAEARFITVMKNRATFALDGERAAFILALASPTDQDLPFADRVVRKFKEAADQLTGERRGVLFVEIEGPHVDPPLMMVTKAAFEAVMPQLFKTRPFLEFVILGFPGPPFSSGVSYPIRNTRIKRRNQSFIARKLERYSRPRQSATIPYKEFRQRWWFQKYRWDHKTMEDIEDALKGA